MNFSIEWIGFIGIALSITAYLPQVIHLLREHCSAGLSPWAYCIWVISAVLLLVYAIVKRDPIFMLLQGYKIAKIILFLYYCFKYSDELCEDHGGEALKARLQRKQGELDT